MKKLINITELCRKINLNNTSSKKILSHTLRYWEKEFSQIKPKKINNRRYYSNKDVEIIKNIKFLLKDQNISILGVKKILNYDTKNLDDHNLRSLSNKIIVKKYLRNKTKNILDKIKNLRIYGKKNTS